MRATLAALLLLVSSSPAPIAVRVSPQTCMAPCAVRVTVTIEPHELNRFYVVQIDGEMFQGTTRPLEGDKASKTQPEIWFKGLPPGEYEVIAVVYRATVKKSEAGRAAAHVIVGGATSSPTS